MLTSMKGEINNNTITVEDFNTPLTPKDRSTKQKINMETQTLSDTIDQLDLTDIYRTFLLRTEGCITITDARFKSCFCPPESSVTFL